MKKIFALLAVFLLAGEATAQIANGNGTAQAGAAAGNIEIRDTGNVRIQGGDVPKQHPQVPVAPAGGSTVVATGLVPEHQAGHSASVTARELDDYFQILARPAVEGGRELPGFMRPSTTKRTMLTLAGHQNIFWLQKGEQRPDVKTNMTGVATLIPVAILNAQVAPEILKAGYSMNQSAVLQDGVNDLMKAEELAGLGKLECLGHPRFWGGGYGQRTEGSGVTAGVGANIGIANLGVSGTKVDGLNFVVNAISIACIVGVPANPGDPGAISFDVRSQGEKDAAAKAAAEAQKVAEAAAKTAIEAVAGEAPPVGVK